MPTCDSCGIELKGLDQIFDCTCCGGNWCVICWCDKDIGGDGYEEGVCSICENDTELQ